MLSAWWHVVWWACLPLPHFPQNLTAAFSQLDWLIHYLFFGPQKILLAEFLGFRNLPFPPFCCFWLKYPKWVTFLRYRMPVPVNFLWILCPIRKLMRNTSLFSWSFGSEYFWSNHHQLIMPQDFCDRDMKPVIFFHITLNSCLRILQHICSPWAEFIPERTCFLVSIAQLFLKIFKLGEY